LSQISSHGAVPLGYWKTASTIQEAINQLPKSVTHGKMKKQPA